MKIGRNDPCPCGSGKKYKKCCMNNIVNIASFTESETEDSARDGLFSSVEITRISSFEDNDQMDQAMHEYSQFCESLPESADVPSFMEWEKTSS